MSDPGAADAARATALRALADRVETVMDDALAAARTELWECANADDVREHLGGYQAAARSAATELRAEAGSADALARRKREAAEPSTATSTGAPSWR